MVQLQRNQNPQKSMLTFYALDTQLKNKCRVLWLDPNFVCTCNAKVPLSIIPMWHLWKQITTKSVFMHAQQRGAGAQGYYNLSPVPICILLKIPLGFRPFHYMGPDFSV